MIYRLTQTKKKTRLRIYINQTPRLTLTYHNAQAVFMTLNKKDGGKKGRLQSMHKGGWKRKLKHSNKNMDDKKVLSFLAIEIIVCT